MDTWPPVANGTRPGRSRRYRQRLSGLVAAALISLVAASCSDGPPAAPSASAGVVQSRTIPTSISTIPLTNQHGETVSLSSFRGKTMLVAPFLTLCSDICPMTSGNLLQVQNSLAAAHVADKVQFVELSVDPDRDTPSRLAAYATLTGATWQLVTESDANLAAIAHFFGWFYQKVPQDNPPAVDWLTGKPLTYDVNHSDGYVLIDPQGIERFSTGAAPDFSGHLDPTLKAFLNEEGRDHLAHPPQPGWTPSDALASLGWMIGQPIPLHPA
jgi:protein SCO1